ncbi:macro domain-containing protein [Hirsutella rhossiliensis]|uniref:Macro domain-containing protein n=1 Tax=Hirsutella rhossiliensis TaxID=111463 RepID=A0A9P8N708_9HYPO|nr:macro domain-containing protein [Hirsutella rhossiliensis]KAH0965802.1 macro domain-containing protein [Hirsutella rhossiliensis]
MPRTQDILVQVLDHAQCSEEPCERRLPRHKLQKRLDRVDEAGQRQLLQQMLCLRHPDPLLPAGLLDDIDLALRKWMSQRLLTRAETIKPALFFARDGTVSVWKGDLTALANVTVIANAANYRAIGCFQPSHRCIDNAIHTWAGPRLRDDCYALMAARGRDLDPGECIVTRGHCLPAAHVVHVLGPQLAPGGKPEPRHEEQLAQCYRSVLEAAETLPAGADGRKRVALCGISTGLFAFPARHAAEIAVRTVAAWLHDHLQTTVTDVIFNTFTDTDHGIYQDILSSALPTWRRSTASSPNPSAVVECESMVHARQWLNSADAVVVSAGAGLSAADGLDYTSTALFTKEFPGFLKYGFRTLYSVFGYSGWPTEQDRWGYFATHLGLVKSWPPSPMYQGLISWLDKLGPDAHVRTSNADGLFVANGWAPEKLSTPQGSYSVLQCLSNCHPDSAEPSEPWLKAAQQSLDPRTQRLTDPGRVPRCRRCDGMMGICVRADHRFNDAPFKDGERRWKEFKERMRANGKDVVILELGVGSSTPGVLRWPNEDWARSSEGRVKLVRVAMGPESAAPSDLEEEGLAASINGDIAAAIGQLLSRSTAVQ